MSTSLRIGDDRYPLTPFPAAEVVADVKHRPVHGRSPTDSNADVRSLGVDPLLHPGQFRGVSEEPNAWEAWFNSAQGEEVPPWLRAKGENLGSPGADRPSNELVEPLDPLALSELESWKLNLASLEEYFNLLFIRLNHLNKMILWLSAQIEMYDDLVKYVPEYAQFAEFLRSQVRSLEKEKDFVLDMMTGVADQIHRARAKIKELEK